jgi:hypothetical protein
MQIQLITALVLSVVATSALAAPSQASSRGAPSSLQNKDYQIKLPLQIRSDDGSIYALQYSKRAGGSGEETTTTTTDAGTQTGEDSEGSGSAADDSGTGSTRSDDDYSGPKYSDFTGSVSTLAGLGSLGVAAANFAGTNHTF